jgi:hypothetical protein
LFRFRDRHEALSYVYFLGGAEAFEDLEGV